MIDSRDFLNAKKLAETQVLLPPGPRIAFAGGVDCNDYRRIWDALDKVRGKHPDMVLLHGAGPKGAERIAACWADNRKVPQVAFKPDWTRHKNAAPFKRNDAMLEALPIGVIVFPGSGNRREPCRQGAEDGDSGVALREGRRMSAISSRIQSPLFSKVAGRQLISIEE